MNFKDKIDEITDYLKDIEKQNIKYQKILRDIDSIKDKNISCIEYKNSEMIGSKGIYMESDIYKNYSEIFENEVLKKLHDIKNDYRDSLEIKVNNLHRLCEEIVDE